MNPFETPKSGYPHWQGPDRRVQDCGTECKAIQIIKDHTEDEMDRYDQIINKINHNEEKSNERHDETQQQLSHLAQSIEAFMAESHELYGSIKRAFPKDLDTKQPDYDGHRKAHEAWIEDARDSKELKGYVKKVVIGAAAIAIVSWLWAVVWPAFLAGPK